MRSTPGFTADASLGPAKGWYRSMHARSLDNVLVQPAQFPFPDGSFWQQIVEWIRTHVPCKEGRLLGKYAHSECRGHRWHVVTYASYQCPDGMMQTVEEDDTKTRQRC